jgi:hypothetical protein
MSSFAIRQWDPRGFSSKSFVSGHGFIRAEDRNKGSGFSPCARSKAQWLMPSAVDVLWHG